MSESDMLIWLAIVIIGLWLSYKEGYKKGSESQKGGKSSDDHNTHPDRD